MKIMSIFGTRPEAIKMCPLIKEIEKQADMESVVCLTGQHREMVEPIIRLFGTKVHYNLDIMKAGQTLTTITSDILLMLEPVLAGEKPDVVLVHGDTTTSFAAALAAFYQKIPIAHVEAGLRSYDRYSPYPEEMNRTLTARLADLHFAPTENNRNNLEREGIQSGISITGNTVMDAFHTTIRGSYQFHDEVLKKLNIGDRKWILLTAHRRENIGEPMEQIFSAVRKLVEDHNEINLVFPVHPNPKVREAAMHMLKDRERIYLTQPLDVEDMHNLIKKSWLVMTDSGGLQEEAPACGVPVLVLRAETERPEAVEAGTVKVIGNKEADIICQTEFLLRDEKEYNRMAQAVSPYGDGTASLAIVNALRKWEQNNRV